jgi:NADH-quinone oxidoreductase subunit J
VEQVVFYIFAAIAVISSLLVVVQRRAVYSALALILCFGSIAVLFYQLGAYFIAAIQVIVYAGAIMVLFVFVVMLIDPDSEIFALNRVRSASWLGIPVALVFGLVLLWGLSELNRTAVANEPTSLDLATKGGIQAVAKSLFSDYLLPFEVTSILILVAVLGAMVLAKKS